MVVQHNLTAMNSNRMLGLTTASQAKSTEKLSSGYKINRAADDAAGLSISEKMRKQIRGLTQASLNAQDGISAVQTAEGALTEVHDMLQRMNELAVKSANGTNSEDDRGYIQDEIDQLVKEIDRVSETTKFNETYLLKGVKTDEDVTSLDSVSIKAGKEFKESFTIKAGNKFYAVDAAGTQKTLDETTAKDELAKIIDAEGNVKAGYKIYKTEASTDEWGVQLPGDIATATDIKKALDVTAEGLMDSTGKEIKAADLKTYFDQNGVYKGGLYSKLSQDGADGGTGKKGDLKEIGADRIDDFVTVTTKTGKRSVIPIWLLRWLSTPTTTSWLRQVRLCWLSPIRLTRVYCLCYSKLKLRSGCFLRGTNHICKSYVRTKGQSMTGCPFWVLIRPFDHPKISFPILSKNYHSNLGLPV